jgi:hypothetical protein
LHRCNRFVDEAHITGGKHQRNCAWWRSERRYQKEVVEHVAKKKMEFAALKQEQV